MTPERDTPAERVQARPIVSYNAEAAAIAGRATPRLRITLEQMAAEVMQAWKTEHPELVAKWDRAALLEQATAVAEMAKDEAESQKISEREALMEILGIYPSPPPFPEVDEY